MVVKLNGRNGRNGHSAPVFHTQTVFVYDLYLATGLAGKLHKQAIEIVARVFKSATLIHTRGLWEGTIEDSSIIRVVVPQEDKAYTESLIVTVSRAVCLAYNQAAIYLTIEEKQATLLVADELLGISAS